MPEPRPRLTFPEFQQKAAGKELAAFPSLLRWYQEGVKKFPEMTATRGKVALTDGQGWYATYKFGQQKEVTGVEKVANDDFMAIEAIEVAKDGKVSHAQAGLFEATKPIDITTEFGEAELNTSAFIGVVMDHRGNMLVGLGQEPLADTPNKVVAKTPLQTSTGKFELVFGNKGLGIQGDPTRDQAFFQTIATIFPAATPDAVAEKFLAHISQPGVLWPMGPINANRMHSPNSAFVLVVDDNMREALELNGFNRWTTAEERQALEKAGVMNTIASAAFSAATKRVPQLAELPPLADSQTYDEGYTAQIEGKLRPLTQLWSWIEKRRNELAQTRPYTVTRVGAVADGDANKEIRNPQDATKLLGVQNGTFFTYAPRRVDTIKADGSPLTFTQGVVEFATAPLTLTINGEQKTLNTSGIVIALADPRGNYLVSLDREPTSHAPDHVQARTLQASVPKLQQILAGNTDLDPTLAAILPILLHNNMTMGGLEAFIQEQIDAGRLKLLPPADGARIDSVNIGVTVTVPRGKLHRDVENHGENYWANPKEIAAMEEAEFLNTHAKAMIPEVRKQRHPAWKWRRTYR